MTTTSHASKFLFSCIFNFVTLLASVTAWAANPGKVIHTFQGGSRGQRPAAQMVVDAAGNVYGIASTTIVYKMSPIAGGGWDYQIICRLTNESSLAGLVLDVAGNLYGAGYNGGDYGSGSYSN
jgi:hypothetical protein